jgi:hypothetical protein
LLHIQAALASAFTEAGNTSKKEEKKAEEADKKKKKKKADLEAEKKKKKKKTKKRAALELKETVMRGKREQGERTSSRKQPKNRQPSENDIEDVCAPSHSYRAFAATPARRMHY